MKSRTYTQGARAEATAENTRRIVEAALELFVELPFDQVTLNAVAERAGVGLQTVIRRVGTKDGLVRAVNEWVGPQVAADLGPPESSSPDDVAAAFARHYERWARTIERSQHQSEASPTLAEYAERGRRAHRQWVASAFASVLDDLPTTRRRQVYAQLVAVTGVEVWLVLRRHQQLGPAQARSALADLISGVLSHLTQKEPS